jgi:serine/threonine protein kinase
MAAPVTSQEFLDLVRKSGVLEEKRLESFLQKQKTAGSLPADPAKLAGQMVQEGWLTRFQAEQFMLGKWKRFTIGKYKVLDRIGTGGMGQVFLCEHKLMRRRVAVKVLPTAKAADPASLQRFYREARAVAALDHPNIVHAYDIDQEDNLHFLVMEYVDGASFQEMIKRAGPMDVTRACHYIRHAALGLGHAHTAGLVHRDIKPGNILVDRAGTVKILDMGLARFFNDEDDVLTRKYDESVLGTADYLAPEQTIDSHAVDIRADIYSLGATFYFLLAGQTPFGEGTIAQKLIWHQSRQPKPLVQLRPDVPPGVAAIIDKMMAKEPAQRYQIPAEVAQALAPWTQSPIGPPPTAEMPALGPVPSSHPATDAPTMVTPGSGGSSSPGSQRSWPGLSGASSSPTASATPSGRSGASSAPRIFSSPASPQPRTSLAQDEDGLAWENVIAETTDVKAGTTPQQGRLAPRSAQVREHRRNVVVLSLISVALLGALAVAAWFLFRSPEPVAPPPRLPLQVSKDAGRPKAFRSIQQALRHAEPGDIIELWDEKHQENVTVDPSRGRTDVTLRAAEGKQISWSARDDKNPILSLSAAESFKLQGDGITLDGQRKVQDLVVLSLTSPGLTLQDVRLQGFTRYGMRIVNCQGEEKKPVRLVKLQTDFKGDIKKAAALFFDATTGVLPATNDFIEIKDCDFRGFPDLRAAIRKKDDSVIGNNMAWPTGMK